MSYTTIQFQNSNKLLKKVELNNSDLQKDDLLVNDYKKRASEFIYAAYQYQLMDNKKFALPNSSQVSLFQLA